MADKHHARDKLVVVRIPMFEYICKATYNSHIIDNKGSLMPNDTRPTTGQEALELLKEGNARYVDSLTSTDEYMQRRPELVKDQNPLAIILGCSDARVPVEIVFDQGLGDLDEYDQR